MYSKFSIVEFTSQTLLTKQKEEMNKVSNMNSSTLEHMPKKRGRPAKNTTTNNKSNNTCMFIKSTESFQALSFPSRYHPYIHVNTKLSQTTTSSPHVNNVNCKDSSSSSSSPPTTHVNTLANGNSVNFKQRIVRTSISIRELLN